MVITSLAPLTQIISALATLHPQMALGYLFSYPDFYNLPLFLTFLQCPLECRTHSESMFFIPRLLLSPPSFTENGNVPEDPRPRELLRVGAFTSLCAQCPGSGGRIFPSHCVFRWFLLCLPAKTPASLRLAPSLHVVLNTVSAPAGTTVACIISL